MASQIDATVPADNVPADKADLRANALIAKNEITTLQQKTSVPGLLAYTETGFDSL